MVNVWKKFLDVVLLCGREDDAPFMEKSDIDGFFAFFMNSLLDITLTITLCTLPTINLTSQFIISNILPGTALILLIGNYYYYWEAKTLMRKEKRSDVCASPFGIATPSLVSFTALIMTPVYADTQDSMVAYRVALFSTFVTGWVTIAGAFYCNWLKEYFPKAAMLSGLSGIAITIISMDFLFKIFEKPILCLPPLFLFFYMLFTGTALPYRVPTGVGMIVLGTIIGWILYAAGSSEWEPAKYDVNVDFYYPPFSWEFLNEYKEASNYLVISIPLALINIVNSVQNISSAESAGDSYNSVPTMIIQGLLMIVGSFLGNPFPTVLYIGHPMYKKIGARATYSLMNGVVIIILCTMGVVTAILKVIPQESFYPVLLIVGIGIIAESYDAIPSRHGVALAFGLLPVFASWALTVINNTISAANFVLETQYEISNTTVSLQQCSEAFGTLGTLALDGVIALSAGFLLSSLLLTAMLCFVIDRREVHAALCSMGLAILSYIGVIHAFDYNSSGSSEQVYVGMGGRYIASAPFAGTYAAIALILFLVHLYRNIYQGSKRRLDETSQPDSVARSDITSYVKEIQKDDLDIESGPVELISPAKK
eukprot:Nk52_evm17s307 gene=Nk52_evmTU17s307